MYIERDVCIYLYIFPGGRRVALAVGADGAVLDVVAETC